ncbi:ufm1-conjugating enzyme 1 [Clonorchis sinensis]|uniref:Ubiquitin-fold modifier-conjugating enzyme 1 n=1 Tax=Clonorchis sinensis TaxID=79923 RepID=G7YRV4_CLOSI|nr:ufm1-conjugating enzyme 1 [Clonorchis sinensis]
MSPQAQGAILPDSGFVIIDNTTSVLCCYTTLVVRSNEAFCIVMEGLSIQKCQEAGQASVSVHLAPRICIFPQSMVDEATKKTLAAIPLLKTRAGPRDGDLWVQRLKEEYLALIKYIQDMKKYEFDLSFDIPVSYPSTNPELALPELDGKTAKMYRGGKICLTEHFKPLWSRNVPKFGIAHAIALGLGPWVAVEIPDLIAKGIVKHKDDE